MFLVNGMTVHALFNLDATWSFVSFSLSKKFDDASSALDYPLEVKIVDDCSRDALRVHRGCILELLWKRYLIDLVPITLWKNIILDMDRLSRNGD